MVLYSGHRGTARAGEGLILSLAGVSAHSQRDWWDKGTLTRSVRAPHGSNIATVTRWPVISGASGSVPGYKQLQAEGAVSHPPPPGNMHNPHNFVFVLEGYRVPVSATELAPNG